jgi:hypothetical protein
MSVRSTRSLTDEEKTIIEEGVRKELKDPESAQFRWMPYVHGEDIYCGYVNSRNSYGGYVGFSPYQVFVVRKGDVPVLASLLGIASVGDKAETYAITKTCADSGYKMYG